MVTGEMITLAAFQGRPLHHVDRGAVMADKIEVGGGKLAHLVAKALADNQAITAINILALEELAKELAMGGAQTP